MTVKSMTYKSPVASNAMSSGFNLTTSTSPEKKVTGSLPSEVMLVIFPAAMSVR